MSKVPVVSASVSIAGSVKRGSAATPGWVARAACSRIRAARSRAAIAFSVSGVTISPAPSGMDECTGGVRTGVHVSSTTIGFWLRAARAAGRSTGISAVLTAMSPTIPNNPKPTASTRYAHATKYPATPAPATDKRMASVSTSFVRRCRAAIFGAAANTASRSSRWFRRSVTRASRSNSRRCSTISRVDIWLIGVSGRMPKSCVVAAIRRALRSTERVSARSRRLGAKYTNQRMPAAMSVKVGPRPLSTFSTVNRGESFGPQACGWCVVTATECEPLCGLPRGYPRGFRWQFPASTARAIHRRLRQS